MDFNTWIEELKKDESLFDRIIDFSKHYITERNLGKYDYESFSLRDGNPTRIMLAEKEKVILSEIAGVFYKIENREENET